MKFIMTHRSQMNKVYKYIISKGVEKIIEYYGNTASQEYGLLLNELKKNGITSIDIDDHIRLLNYYIDTSYMLDRSYDRYDELANLLTVNK